jgi:hypothetical protein
MKCYNTSQRNSPIVGCFFVGKIMAKAATIWTPLSGTGEVVPSNEGDYLKTSLADYLILATGGTDRLLLGANVVTPKAATVWAGSDS